MSVFRANRITPQEKMVSVNKRQGNPSANKGQGTTFIMWDSLRLDGSQQYKFFDNTAGKPWQLSNLGKGTLTAGETTTLLYGQITFIEYQDPFAATPNFTVVSVSPLSSSLQFQNGILQFMIANQRVIKPMSLTIWMDTFNKSANFADQNVFYFGTDLVITSFLDFVAQVDLPGAGVTVANTVVRLTIEGDGGILQPKEGY